MAIKSIKLLSNYKMNVEVVIEENKYFLRGYLDSGNTLLIDNIPVIFLSETYLKTDKFKEMLVEGIGSNKCKYSKGIIKINGINKNVICAFVRNISFKGCECLLNINLMEGIE